MFLTSKNPEHLKLGKDLEQTTQRMTHLRRMLDLAQQSLTSGVNVIDTYVEFGPNGLVTPDPDATDRISKIKMVLFNLSEIKSIIEDEFELQVEEYDKLEQTLASVQKQSRAKQAKPTPPTPVVAPAPVSTFPEATPAPSEAKPN